MKPTVKTAKLTNMLEEFFGRTTAIESNHCVPTPIGCGQPITGFRDELSEREYRISGLCQECQDSIFVGDN